MSRAAMEHPAAHRDWDWNWCSRNGDSQRESEQGLGRRKNWNWFVRPRRPCRSLRYHLLYGSVAQMFDGGFRAIESEKPGQATSWRINGMGSLLLDSFTSLCYCDTTPSDTNIPTCLHYCLEEQILRLGEGACA